MERENDQPIEILISAFAEAEQRLSWARLIKNNFRRNAQVRKTENECYELSEQIIDQANCRTLLIAALLPPSARRIIKKPDSTEEVSPGDDPQEVAFDSLLEPYWNADEETKKNA